MIDQVTMDPGPQTIEEAAAVSVFLKGYRAANGEPGYTDTEPEQEDGADEQAPLEAECEVSVRVYSEQEITEEEQDKLAFHAACAFVARTGRKLGAHLDEILDAVETADSMLHEDDE